MGPKESQKTNWTCPLKLDKATKVIQNKNKRLLSIKVGNRPLGTRADHLWGVFRSSWCDDLLFQKLVHRFSSGFQTRENCWKHEAAGWVFLLFYCFRIASQSRPRNKRKWKYWRIFHTSASLLLWKIVLLWWFVFSDTEGTGEIGNSKSSFNHFMTSAYFKNCKINREWCGFFSSLNVQGLYTLNQEFQKSNNKRSTFWSTVANGLLKITHQMKAIIFP